MKYLIACLLLLSSCGPSSIRDLRAEGEAETLKLARLLHEIDTKDELTHQLPKIKNSYARIAELVVKVREFGSQSVESEPSEASDRLFAELARLYEMPGCRELMERAQDEAIARLRPL